MAQRFSPGDFVALGAVFMTGAALMGSLAWMHMSALKAVYGVVCGSGAGLLSHCPACPAAMALFLVGARVPGAGRFSAPGGVAAKA